MPLIDPTDYDTGTPPPNLRLAILFVLILGIGLAALGLIA